MNKIDNNQQLILNIKTTYETELKNYTHCTTDYQQIPLYSQILYYSIKNKKFIGPSFLLSFVKDNMHPLIKKRKGTRKESFKMVLYQYDYTWSIIPNNNIIFYHQPVKYICSFNELNQNDFYDEQNTEIHSKIKIQTNINNSKVNSDNDVDKLIKNQTKKIRLGTVKSRHYLLDAYGISDEELNAISLEDIIKNAPNIVKKRKS